MEAHEWKQPECCGQPCGWAEHAGVWVCQHRVHHCYNDFGEGVDRYGRTALDIRIQEARRENPARNLG